MGNKAVGEVRRAGSEADKKKPGGANLGKKPHYQSTTRPIHHTRNIPQIKSTTPDGVEDKD